MIPNLYIWNGWSLTQSIHLKLLGFGSSRGVPPKSTHSPTKITKLKMGVDSQQQKSGIPGFFFHVKLVNVFQSLRIGFGFRGQETILDQEMNGSNNYFKIWTIFTQKPRVSRNEKKGTLQWTNIEWKMDPLKMYFLLNMEFPLLS